VNDVALCPEFSAQLGDIPHITKKNKHQDLQIQVAEKGMRG
jgi:hypothetical protein